MIRRWIIKKPLLKMYFVETLCFLCQVTFGLLGSAMMMIFTYKHHKNFKVTVKKRVSSHPAFSEVLQWDVLKSFPDSSRPNKYLLHWPASTLSPRDRRTFLCSAYPSTLRARTFSGTWKRLNNYLMNEWMNDNLTIDLSTKQWTPF